MKTIKTGIKAIFILSLLLSIPQTIFATEQIWDFDNPADYTVSDPAKIEIADGVGKLIGSPGHYPTVRQSIVPNDTINFTGSISAFSDVSETTFGQSEIRYYVSSDNEITWKCWEHGVWETLDSCTDGSKISDINANISTLDTDGGEFKWKAELHGFGPTGQGAAQATLDKVEIKYEGAKSSGGGGTKCGLACKIGNILKGEKHCRDLRALNGVDYGVSDESLCKYPVPPIFITNEVILAHKNKRFIVNIEAESKQDLTYNLVDSIGTNNDTSYLSINHKSGELRFKQSWNLGNLPTHLMRSSPIKKRNLPLNEFKVEVEVFDGYNRVRKDFKIQIKNFNKNDEDEKVETNEPEANRSPIFFEEISVIEGETFVTNVSAFDSDGDTLTYSIILQDSGDKFQINSTTGKLEFKVAPDFENPQSQDDNNLYLVTVKASDGENFAEKLLKIRVIDLLEDEFDDVTNSCEQITCNQPPANQCADERILTVYTNLGTCKNINSVGECNYDFEFLSCETGTICHNGECVLPLEGAPEINEIAFTEVMYDTLLPLNENKSEWFEIHSQVDHEIELSNCVINNSSGENTLELNDLKIPAHGYLLFARSDDPSLNGGLENVSRVFDFSLNNGGDTLTLTCGAGNIDTLIYEDNSFNWPNARGASIQLDAMAIDEIDTNDGQLWCTSSHKYLDEPLHYGTPGTANHPCEVDYCRLQWNPNIETYMGERTEYYVQFYRFGVTNQDTSAAVPSEWKIEFGFGPDGAEPESNSWQWQNSVINHDWDFEENSDEWMSLFIASEEGRFDTAFRISTDEGSRWIYCDANDAGNTDGFNDPGSLIVDEKNNCYREDLPDNNFEDTNCDGIDGTIEDAIFLSIRGDNNDPGTIIDPVRTFSRAMALAMDQDKYILADKGVYNETVRLQSGIKIYGGYDSENNWSRSNEFETVLSGGRIGMYAFNLNKDTLIDRVSIRSKTNNASSGSSYALYMRDSANYFTMTNSFLIAGRAGNGRDGVNGSICRSESNNVNFNNGVGGINIGKITQSGIYLPSNGDNSQGGGRGGTGAGGSFGALIFNSSPILSNISIITGDGSQGGSGGIGRVFCGGDGGGGGGGPSIGILNADLLNNGATPILTNIVYQLGSTGRGGHSTGNSGEDGLVTNIYTTTGNTNGSDDPEFNL